MLEHIGRLASKAARALSRQTKGSTMIGAFVGLPDGQRALAWAADKCTAEDVEKFAVGLLHRLASESRREAMECEGCAARYERATNALAALGVGADGQDWLTDKPRPGHVH